MKEGNVISIDLAKNFMHVLVMDTKGVERFSSRVSAAKLFDVVLKWQPKRVLMEACSSAHYWGRRFQAEGIEVFLYPPTAVAQLRQGEKNDSNDALAIYETSFRPKVIPVAVKSEAHQYLQLYVRRRESLIHACTELTNAMRGYLTEFGYSFGLGKSSFRKGVEQLLGSEAVDERLREFLQADFSKLIRLYEERQRYDQKLKTFCRKDKVCQAFMKKGGVGPVTAAALRATIVEPSAFRNGRHFSAYLGLVPRQHSTGGKSRLGRITKKGNSYLRQLLIHGGRSFIWSCENKSDEKSLWATRKKKEIGFNKACVAVANKNARQLWQIIATHPEFRLAG